MFAKHRKLCRRKFWVKVLDDGTPEKYLQKIKEKHPKVEIINLKIIKIKLQQLQKIYNLERN
jgi:hypothetical protein